MNTFIYGLDYFMKGLDVLFIELIEYNRDPARAIKKASALFEEALLIFVKGFNNGEKEIKSLKNTSSKVKGKDKGERDCVQKFPLDIISQCKGDLRVFPLISRTKKQKEVL